MVNFNILYYNMYLLILLVGILFLLCILLLYYIYTPKTTNGKTDEQIKLENKRNELLKIIYDPTTTKKII